MTSTYGEMGSTTEQEHDAFFPVMIDLSAISHHGPARESLIQDIGKTCQRTGCFQVLNHGISSSVLEDAFEVASNFFRTPIEEKKHLISDDVRRPVRYFESPRNGEDPAARLVLKHYAYPLDHWVQLWPDNPRDYREKMGRYAVQVRRVALKVTHAIFESMGLGPAYQRDELDDDGVQFVAVNYYPRRPQAGAMLGAAPHTDHGYVTVLAQSSPGLQVIGAKDGHWEPVLGRPGALHVHVGDQLEVLSNGRYKAALHRATLDPEAERDRISIASIHSLAMHQSVATADELVDEQHPRKYRDISFAGFLDYLSSMDARNGRSFLDTLRLTPAN